MKKLITAIAAIATSFGLFADGPVAFTDSVLSDIQSKTNNLVVGYDTTGATMLDDTGDVTVNWFADSLKTDFTTKMETYEQPELKVGEDEEGPYKYLAIDTDVGDPVLRTFNNVVEDTGVDNFKYNNIEISQHGVFIDTWTTFTLFDDGPMKDAPGDSKILVWALETDPEETDPKKLYGAAPGSTNLMVSCGIADAFGAVTPTNYVLDVDGIVPETMYRLTIRADKDGANNTKFRVYLDGEQLKTVDLGGGTTLDEFPSLVGGNQQLGAAGFGGTGSLKGIDLLTETDAPAQVPFAIDPTYLTVTWNEGVASFTVAQDDCVDQVIEVTGSGETNLVVKAGAATVTPTFVSNPQYKLQDFLNEDETLNLEYEGNVASIDIPLYADASTLAIIAVQDREGAELWIKLADEENMRKIGAARPRVKDAVAAFGELTEEEISALETVKIVLLEDEQYTDFGDWASLEAGEIILDLNGHTMEAIEPWNPDDSLRTMINISFPLTIVDSSEAGGGMIKGIIDSNNPLNDVWPILNDSSLTIMEAEGTAECKFFGTVYNEVDDDATIDIYGGLFSDITYLQPSDLVTLPDGKEWSADTIDGYYYLTEPGSVTLSLTKGAHNTIASEPAAGSVTPGAEVTVTVTPDEGYQFAYTPDGWDAGASGTIVSNFTITADTAIIAPDATAIPVELTVNKGEGVASVTYTVNGNAPGETVKIGDVIKITDVTYATGYEADGTYVTGYEYTVVAADVTAGSISWTVLAKKQTFTVTVDASNATLSTNGAPVAASSFTATYGTEFTLTATAADGYKDAKIKIDDVEVTSLTVTKPTTIVVTATQMATWTVTVDATLGEHVLSVTPDPASVREDAASKTITLSATFESGYKRAYFTVDGVQIEGNTFEITKSVTVNAVAQPNVTEPIPPLPDNPTEQQKKDAVDAVVAKNTGLAGIVTTENYSAFRDWARATGTDPVVAEQAVLDSDKAGVSFQLSPIVEGATLFENEPVVNFTAIAGNGNNWDVTLQLKDGASGEEVELAIGVAAARFAQFIKKGNEVNAITDPCSADDIVAAVKPGDDQTSKQVKLTVVPPTGGKGFIKFLAEKPTQSETP